jgi:hypothetical protein
MNCTRCRSPLSPARREEHPRSVLEWYECPVCRRRELVATPCQGPRPDWRSLPAGTVPSWAPGALA